MGADGFQQDGLDAFMLDKFEDNSQVIFYATRPRTGEIAFEFMGLEGGMKRVFGELR